MFGVESTKHGFESAIDYDRAVTEGGICAINVVSNDKGVSTVLSKEWIVAGTESGFAVSPVMDDGVGKRVREEELETPMP
jgi:hypothetical protein